MLLGKVHLPVFAGSFCQALQDSFPDLGFDVDDLEFVNGFLHDWDNGTAPDHYDDIWNWKHISGIGIPYFRKAIGLMADFWPDIDPYESIYCPASTASALTGLDLVRLNRLSEPGGPIRSRRPSKNRRLVHLGDLAEYMKTQNPHL